MRNTNDPPKQMERIPLGRQIAIARNKWFASDEGQNCLASLPTSSGGSRYLRNRLEAAFIAGVDAVLNREVKREASDRPGADSVLERDSSTGVSVPASPNPSSSPAPLVPVEEQNPGIKEP